MDNSTRVNPTILKILWLALAQSHIIFGFITYFVIAKSSTGTFNLMTSYVLFGIALSCGLVAWFMFSKAKALTTKRSLNPEEKQKNLESSFSLYLISWVVCESISIFGLLMVSMLGEEALSTATILFVLGIGLHLLLKPRLKFYP